MALEFGQIGVMGPGPAVVFERYRKSAGPAPALLPIVAIFCNCERPLHVRGKCS